MKKLVVAGSLVLAGAITIVAIYGYLRWQDQTGYRNLNACNTIKAGASLEQVKAVLAHPLAEGLDARGIIGHCATVP